MQRIPPNTKRFSRQLRRQMTDAELYLWRHLRMRQLINMKFRRQHPVGSYVLDFACIEARLAVEIDGGQHATQQEKDNSRTLWLEVQGWRVLRFWNNEVLLNIESVVGAIQNALMEGRLDSLPPP